MGKEHSEATDTWRNYHLSKRERQIIDKALNIPCMKQNRLYSITWGTDQGKHSSVFEHHCIYLIWLQNAGFELQSFITNLNIFAISALINTLCIFSVIQK